MHYYIVMDQLLCSRVIHCHFKALQSHFAYVAGPCIAIWVNVSHSFLSGKRKLSQPCIVEGNKVEKHCNQVSG